MPKLEYLAEEPRRSILFYPCLEFDTTPWTPMQKELSQSKVALITSSAVHLRTDKPFLIHERSQGDSSYRVIPSSSEAKDIVQSHVSIGFDRTGVYRDINIVFPLDRLRELVQRNTIGNLAENFYSFNGASHINPRPLMEEIAPELARRLKDEGVNVVLLTPI